MYYRTKSKPLVYYSLNMMHLLPLLPPPPIHVMMCVFAGFPAAEIQCDHHR